MLGLFLPQLGWEAAEAALLIRWAEERDEAALEAVTSLPQITGAVTEAWPRPCGPADDAISAHRRHLRAPLVRDRRLDLAEFQPLRRRLKDFEPRFEAKVFGLFLAEQSQDDELPARAACC